jgi:hypothetical protein
MRWRKWAILSFVCGCGTQPAATPGARDAPGTPAGLVPSSMPSSVADSEPEPALIASDGLAPGVLRRWGGGGLVESQRGELFVGAKGQPAMLEVRREATKTIFEIAGDGVKASVVVPSKTYPHHHALSPGLDRLVTSDGKVTTLWEVGNPTALATRAGLSGPFAFAGQSIVGMLGRDLVAWEPTASTTRSLATVTGLASMVSAAAAAPVVAVLETRQPKASRNATAHLWLIDVVTGKKRSVDLAVRGSNTRIAVDPDGAFVVAVHNGAVHRLELATQAPLEELFTPDPEPRGYGAPELVVGRQIAAIGSGGGLALFDPWSGNVRRAIDLGARVRSLALSDDGRTLLAQTSLGELSRFQLPSGEEVEPPPGQSWVGAADVDSRTRRAITAGTRLELWDVESGKRIRHAKPPSRIVQVALLGEGALTMDVQGSVDRWDLEKLQASRWHDGSAESDRYERHAKLLAVDSVRERAAFTLRNEGHYGHSRKVRVVDRHGAELFTLELDASALAFDEHGQLAVGHDGDVTLHDADGKPTWRWRHTRTDGQYGSPYALRGLVLHGSLLALEAAHLEIWDREREAVIRGAPTLASAFAFVGSTLVVGGHEGELTSLSLQGIERSALPPMPGRVVAVRASARGVLIASEDGSTMVVDPSWLEPAKAEPPPLEVRLSHAGDVSGADDIAVFGGYRGMSACVTARGEVSCWGANSDGELGFGDSEARAKPTALGLTNVKSLGVAPTFTCVLGDDGRPSCWGRVDPRGRADWRSPTPKPTPMTIYPGEKLHAFSPGRDGWCAIRADRRVECRWGEVVSRVVGFSDARTIARGDGHACAIDGAGKVWCWGDNDEGQIGAGRATREGPAHAVAVEGLAETAAIAAGSGHTCALSRTGSVSCWGAGAYGQLGDGTLASRPRATPVAGIDATAIATGGNATCAISRAGTVSCWGGLHGLGDQRIHATPVTIPGLVDVIAIATTGERSCAIARNGRIDCWGDLSRP